MATTNLTGEKPKTESKGVIGGVIAFLAGATPFLSNLLPFLGGLLGFDISQEAATAITNDLTALVVQIGTMIGGALAVYGRIMATKRIA